MNAVLNNNNESANQNDLNGTNTSHLTNLPPGTLPNYPNLSNELSTYHQLHSAALASRNWIRDNEQYGELKELSLY